MKHIAIDPITRLEGHGKIEIFLDDDGAVRDCFFQVPELRGFEQFCVGRPVEELPRIVTRICGVCPGAHHMASGKTVDHVYATEPPPTARKLREAFYMAHFIHSHIAHFFALAAPDFVVGPTADPAQRNILGVVGKVGVEIGKEVIKHRAYAQKIQEIMAGRATHPVWTLPGGVAKGINREEYLEIRRMGESCLEFSKVSLKLFHELVLQNQEYVDLILGDIYHLDTYFMGLVDRDNRVNFYDGQVRVVDRDGNEVFKYSEPDYLEYVAEHVEDFSYLKFPYLRKIGWKGFKEGPDSGIYQATPLSRLNAAAGMATPLAQEMYEEMYGMLGDRPVKSLMATHWARLIELLYASERLLELLDDEDILSTHIRNIPQTTPGEGVGIVEAPRGTLTHHYRTDENGMVTRVNLIVGTTNNHAAISMAIKKAAEKLLTGKKEVPEGLLNMVEMAFRLFDPCFSCATHSLPGRMPLEVNVRRSDGTLLCRQRQHCS